MGKPKPAPIWDKINNAYHIQFCYKGKQTRFFNIKEKHVANILQARTNSVMSELKAGLRTIPANITTRDYVISQVSDKPTSEEISKEGIPVKLSQLISLYLEYLQPPIKALSTCKIERVQIGHLKRFLSENLDLEIGKISQGYFNKYKAYRYKKGIRTDTVNKEIATFYAVFKFAIAEGFLKNNPLKGMPREKSQISSSRFRTSQEIEKILGCGHYRKEEEKEIKRFRYLTESEIGELLDLTKGKWIYSVLLCFAYTGMRRGELLNLEWQDIDFSRKVIWIHSRKQSSTIQKSVRWVEMPETLCNELIGLWNREKTRFVFVNAHGNQLSKDTLIGNFKELIKNTKFDGIGFHCFRHSLASNLAAKGIKPYVIDGILGHQTQEMRERYRHLFPEQKAEAIGLLNFGR